MNREDEIRAKAHELWLSEGSPEGREHEHWSKAMALVDGSKGTSDDVPAAGPHAKPGLTNEAATPGTGMLPNAGSDDPNQQPSG